MKSIDNVGLEQVKSVYNGPEGRLWELIMGEQVHIGGFASSMDLAEKAGIAEGAKGIDLCCCTGAGMRFLLRFRGAAAMTGVDATETVVELGKRRCADEGLDGKTSFVLADVCDSGLPDGQADFVWGEDAWCYVVDKPTLITEAARLVRPGGTIAFTDWIEGPAGLSDVEAERYLTFMKFPNVLDLDGYVELLEAVRSSRLRIREDLGRMLIST
ncbi:MAG: class I SAM-dependent methyltransferase [Planctomycetota bacterium]|jgi:ubiquinone/menaquinone biosynthesis C-methylase UbiE